METVRGRNFEHSQMHRRILVPGEADVPNLPRLFRIHQGFERPAGGEEAVGILHPDVLVILNQVNVIRLQSPQRFIDLPAGGPVFARLLGDAARGADTPVGDASYCRRGRDCGPTTGARVAGVANGIVVQVVQAGERQATRWAHLYLRYRVRSGNMSRGSCYRARRRPPWIVSPLTRNSLAGAARSRPIIEAQSTRCSARQDFAPY